MGLPPGRTNTTKGDAMLRYRYSNKSRKRKAFEGGHRLNKGHGPCKPRREYDWSASEVKTITHTACKGKRLHKMKAHPIGHTASWTSDHMRLEAQAFADSGHWDPTTGPSFRANAWWKQNMLAMKQLDMPYRTKATTKRKRAIHGLGTGGRPIIPTRLAP